MRIGIDCSQVFDSKGNISGGIGYYTLNLINSLAQTKKEHFFYLFVYKDPSWYFDKRYTNIKIIKLPLDKYKKYLIFMYRHIILPIFFFRYNLDLIHFPANTIPLFYFKKSVLTVHDLAIYINPQWFLKQFLSFYFITPFSIKKCQKIVAVSKRTKTDIMRFFNVNKDKIEVIYEGAGKIIKKSFYKNKYGNYLLVIGTIEPRKNIIRIIKAFEKIKIDKEINIKYPNLKLLVVGRAGWKYEKIFKVLEESIFNKDIIYLNRVNQDLKKSLLINSLVLLFPSLYEGFGLPILEGFLANVPVVTSNIGAMREIGGDAAVLVNPYDFNDVYFNIKKLLLNNKIYQSCIEKGKNIVKQFTWQNTANQTFEVYEKLKKTN
jgi:glycosyltransferase involved in cell wall biosynthesis